MSRYYVGAKLHTHKREAFRHDSTPTIETHGNVYAYVIGPFRTKRGADFMARYGRNNPNCQCVRDAEELAACGVKD